MQIRGLELPVELVEGVQEQETIEVVLVSLIRLTDMLMSANGGKSAAAGKNRQDLVGIAAALTIKLDQDFPGA